MKSFEHIAEGERIASTLFIQPNRESLWCGAFQVPVLDGLFDMTPAEDALPVLDAAITRFNAAPEELRPLLAADDPIGLRGNRGLLVEVRNRLHRHGGTISGAVDESPGASA